MVFAAKNRALEAGFAVGVAQVVVGVEIVDPVGSFALSGSVSSQNLELPRSELH